MSTNESLCNRAVGQCLAMTLLLFPVLLPAGAAAQATESAGRLSLHVVAGPNSGGWSKTEQSTAPGGAPFRYEFASGAGAGLRVVFAVAPRVGIWAAGDLNVEPEGPYVGFYGGAAGQAMVTPRLGAQARLGAGRLDYGWFGLAGATLEWFVGRPLSVGVAAEMLSPIGAGRRNNGLQTVAVRYEGVPARLRIELGWYPGR